MISASVWPTSSELFSAGATARLTVNILNYPKARPFAPGFFLVRLCERDDRVLATKAVMRGLDPRIHRSSKMFFVKKDGLPDQVRQ
jgi:hypothetical protein